MTKTSPPKERGKRYKELLDTAIKVFSRRGYSVATIQDVADEFGVRKGSLYHYIDTKEDLLYQIIKDADEAMSIIISEVAELDAEPIERVRIYIEKLLNWYLEHVEHAKVTFHEWMHLTGDYLKEETKQRKDYEKFIKDMIIECQRNGDISADVDVHLASLYLLGAINAAPEWYRRDGRLGPSELAAAYAAMTVGMLKGTESTKPDKNLKLVTQEVTKKKHA